MPFLADLLWIGLLPLPPLEEPSWAKTAIFTGGRAGRAGCHGWTSFARPSPSVLCDAPDLPLRKLLLDLLEPDLLCQRKWALFMDMSVGAWEGLCEGLREGCLVEGLLVLVGLRVGDGASSVGKGVSPWLGLRVSGGVGGVGGNGGVGPGGPELGLLVGVLVGVLVGLLVGASVSTGPRVGKGVMEMGARVGALQVSSAASSNLS